MASQLNIRSMLDTNKLTGPNFQDWLRNLKIVLRLEKKVYVFTTPIPPIPAEDAADEDQAAYAKWQEDSEVAECLMLASMTPELQKQHEGMTAHEILLHLKELFGELPRTERFDTSKSLFRSKMVEGSSSVQHVLKMNTLIEKLGNLGAVMDHELSIDLILQSLPDSYSQFVMNFHMNKIDCTIPELINMLKTVEPNVKASHKSVMLVGSSNPTPSKRKSKKKGKGKKGSTKAQGGVAKKKKETAPKGTCFHCHKERALEEELQTLLGEPKEGQRI